MGKAISTQYWLFQSHPKEFRLRDALRHDALRTFPVRAHRKNIHPGDKVILWQTGKEPGCYALATVLSEVEEHLPAEEERPFYKGEPEKEFRVKIRVDFNLWRQPLTKDLIASSSGFDAFHAGLPGINYSATEKQFLELVQLARQQNLLAEPLPAYSPEPVSFSPLNLILYGPPGTGKTYQTVNHALSVIENKPLDELALEDREELRRRFAEYIGTGQVVMVTFHPSFSYEDFVEGIKPVVRDGQVVYEVEDGIFKLVCMDARRCVIEAMLKHHPLQQKVEFNQVYQAFLDYLNSKEFSFFDAGKNRFFLQRVHRLGNIVVRAEKSFMVQTIHKAGLEKLYQQFEQASHLLSETEVQHLIDGQDPLAYMAVFSELKNFEEDYLQSLEEENAEEEIPDFELPLIPESVLNQCRKYVLIIDEINRGNLPAIFGELITLIEADKREGKGEALHTVLPYSKLFFSVPPNLYIIGTMNSTDRSIQPLDAALRRRFAFRELRPDPSLIPQLTPKTGATGIDLPKMLEAINRRIEWLLNRDYCLGHGYFIGVETLEDLKTVFSTAILPLLQEYFFNDYSKIGLILGSDFIREKRISGQEGLFAGFDHPFIEEMADRRLYELCPMDDLDEKAFIRIYDQNYS